MTLKFTPPKDLTRRYAIYIPRRNRFIQYLTLGNAKTGFYAHGWGSGSDACTYGPGKILELVDGEWYTLFDIPTSVVRDKLPWRKDVKTYSWHKSSTNRAVQMTREEYADWRLAVFREQNPQPDFFGLR